MRIYRQNGFTVSIRCRRPEPTAVARRLDANTRNGIGDSSSRRDHQHLRYRRSLRNPRRPRVTRPGRRLHPEPSSLARRRPRRHGVTPSLAFWLRFEREVERPRSVVRIPEFDAHLTEGSARRERGDTAGETGQHGGCGEEGMAALHIPDYIRP